MTTTPPQIVTIIEQLGGQQIFAMAFSRAIWAGCDASEPYASNPDNRPRVTLHCARGLKVKGRIRWVCIELEENDTYTVQFKAWQPRAQEVKVISSFELVHADQLRQLVEGETGLRMTLGTMRAVAS